MKIETSEPAPECFETVGCLLCQSRSHSALVQAEDDLTGKPGRFQFVSCTACGFAYQNPRLKAEHIGRYYDDEYIAHRKKQDWGLFSPLYEWAMGKHDRDKLALVRRFVNVEPNANLLDIGCGAGTFLSLAQQEYGAKGTGVDFKDLSALPSMDRIDFRCGQLHEQDFGEQRFRLITMWHFLEHDYLPLQTLSRAKALLEPGGRIVIEVPRLDSLTYRLFHERWPGLQAPQHTFLFTEETLRRTVEKAGLRVTEYLPYGAFPPYFYLFTGFAFKWLQGRGLNLSRAIYPYFIGQLLTAPVMIFQRRLNLAMQTVVCEPV